MDGERRRHPIRFREWEASGNLSTMVWKHRGRPGPEALGQCPTGFGNLWLFRLGWTACIFEVRGEFSLLTTMTWRGCSCGSLLQRCARMDSTRAHGKLALPPRSTPVTNHNARRLALASPLMFGPPTGGFFFFLFKINLIIYFGGLLCCALATPSVRLSRVRWAAERTFRLLAKWAWEA